MCDSLPFLYFSSSYPAAESVTNHRRNDSLFNGVLLAASLSSCTFHDTQPYDWGAGMRLDNYTRNCMILSAQSGEQHLVIISEASTSSHGNTCSAYNTSNVKTLKVMWVVCSVIYEVRAVFVFSVIPCGTDDWAGETWLCRYSTTIRSLTDSLMFCQFTLVKMRFCTFFGSRPIFIRRLEL